ncbi:Xylose isomerase-like TIM barrel [Rubripirellula reticaptiva]|uniref:Xylose isomerase-like TIM barrel n=1 Tax=Rubripirellula reticaptiva TaxID=2528013 RepID=A0A5C6EB17_9BACT|nr:Xylose isomerase-like TIM barrel [Rubripirellula reticaptiva]
MAATALAGLGNQACGQDSRNEFRLNYSLASCMYGYAELATVLPEVAKSGASSIDIWPMIHGNQREQINKMGEESFAALLDQHDVTLGCLTQYKLGPFGLGDELLFAKRFGCPLIVVGGSGPKHLKGDELKSAVGKFAQQMRPHLEQAAECNVTIAIENHGNNLIESPDSMKWLIELCDHPNLGIALAPYHLPQDPHAIAKLIRDIGPRLSVFYAWQHGMGSVEKLPKEQELLQMPGRGDLDFAPLVNALRQINFAGPTEVFMHPVPRGVPILETPEAVTAEVNRGRVYLNGCLNA